MNLPKLFRTSSFRLTLLYVALTAASFLVLFVAIYWSATEFMQRQIDVTVNAEIKEIRHAEDLPRAIADSINQSTAFFYALLDKNGKIRAGNLPELQAKPGVQQWTGEHRLPSYPNIDVRGAGVAVGNDFLFVGMNAHQVHELQESIVSTFLWASVLALAVALAGGSFMSMIVARRIENLSQSSREIVANDLHRRIPLSGRDDEFDHLANSINAMFDKIELLVEGMRQVSTDIAHDLRTPLSRLRHRLELCEAEPDLGKLQNTVQAAIADVDGLLHTFGAMLRISQVESGTRKASFARVDLSEILSTVAEIYQPTIEENQQHLQMHVDRALVVSGDRELLTQLFANLLENASRHSQQGARIAILAGNVGKGVEVSISDTGPGIPPEMRERVFQRFVRLDTSRSTPGNGLGLSMVAAVADLHDVNLTLADNGPGLKVTATFAKCDPRTYSG